ncbi:MAG: flavin reductase family protein, partial [Bacillota bacterium]
PTADMVYQLDFTGTYSGRDIDKFEELSLTAEPPVELEYAPSIAECPVSLECRVKHRLELGSHDAFVAEIVAVTAREDWVDEGGRPSGGADELLSYGGGIYRALGEVIGEHGFSRGER